jgi:radical SAM/Cys-rich protein
MHATLPLIEATDFPAIRRARPEVLQVNLGYRCNQSCVHCHVNAGPTRTEMMSLGTVFEIVAYLETSGVGTLDITGGAPELNPHFRKLVATARSLGVRVMDRCNLTVVEEPGQEDLPDFLAREGVEITASLPCYLEDNVDRQRGTGVFSASIRVLRRLNALGYGKSGSSLRLNLVYNPQGPVLPPPQDELESQYRERLENHHGVVFNKLFVLTNMPIKRFGSMLVSKGKFHDYMALLKAAYRADNLPSVMCRNTLSVDWQGYVYDCDFNQMLDLPVEAGAPRHIRDFDLAKLEGRSIVTDRHCFGCTAGAGSSCGGATT